MSQTCKLTEHSQAPGGSYTVTYGLSPPSSEDGHGPRRGEVTGPEFRSSDLQAGRHHCRLKCQAPGLEESGGGDTKASSILELILKLEQVYNRSTLMFLQKVALAEFEPAYALACMHGSAELSWQRLMR